MKKLFSFRVLISISTSLFPAVSYGTDGTPNTDHSANCSVSLHQKPDKNVVAGNFVIVPSGRDPDVMPAVKAAAQEIFGKGGIAEKLGISLPPHVLEFVPSHQLAVLATTGHHPIGHWHDGAIIATQARGRSGVYEFVLPGCPTCRSFYRDTTPTLHQIPIMLHVAGHNDFAENSVWNKIRPSDAVADSLRLAQLVDRLYQEYDHDEVSQWYQYLLSMSEMQDYARGTFNPPEDFAPALNAPKNPPNRIKHFGDKNVYPDEINPKAPTPSSLQAFVANLPVNTPQWKIDVATLFEKVNRTTPYIVQTKIMNEGWATLMMEGMAEHYSGLTSEYSIEHASLLSGVVGRGDLSNPYYLGVECWNILRKKFNQRPNIQDLDSWARDKAFVTYAHELMSWMTDYDFLKYALDEQWVLDQGLFLSRKAADFSEWVNLPPPDPRLKLKEPEQRIVISSDPKRVIDLLASRLADRSLVFPRIFTNNFNSQGRGVIMLEHENRENIPLKKLEAADTLYVLSQIMKRPVALKTTLITTEIAQVTVPRFPFWSLGGFWGGSKVEPTLVYKLQRAIIEVQPGGQVRVDFEDTNEDGTAKENAALTYNEALTKKMQESIDGYKLDLAGSINEDLVRKEILSIVDQAIDNTTGPSVAMLSHAPTAAKALLEYYNLVQKRLQSAMKDMMKTGATMTGNGKRISMKVLPRIPGFHFDTKLYKAYQKTLPVTPIDLGFSLTANKNYRLMAKDEDVDVQSAGPGKKPKNGERYWGEGKKQGDDEEGEDGEEDGEQSDKPGGDKKGDGPSSPTNIDIPLELYGKLLSEELELPRLKPKAGLTDIMELTREGGVSRPNGPVLYERMMAKALNLGRLSYKKKGKNPSRIDNLRLIQAGLKLISPTDYIVPDSEPTPLPDAKAVLVVYLDMTGSMGAFNGLPIKRAKELLWNLKIFLKNKYKNLEIRYVGMDSIAKEFAEDDFFKSFMGGGTDYEVGLKMSKDILEKDYPEAQWDRYALGIGDAQDGGSERSVKALRELAAIVQYSAFVRTDSPGGFEFFMSAVKTLAEQNRYFNWAELTSDPTSTWAALKKLFGKENVPK